METQSLDFIVPGNGIARLSFALKVEEHWSRRHRHEEEARGFEYELCAGRNRGGDVEGGYVGGGSGAVPRGIDRNFF